MKIEKIKIKNYKNITDMSQELHGNVYLVKGDNEEGKTTFASAFKKLITKTDKPEKPVTVGETHGTIEGVFTDPEGKKYTVILDFTDTKETIRMITPDGISTTKVSDIRQMFDYTNIDFDTFIAWSNTAEGRRKQREIVLGLLSEQDLKEFRSLEQLEETSYNKRTTVNNNLQAHRNMASQIVTDDEKLLVKEYDENIKEINALENCGVALKELEHLDAELTRLETHNTNLESALGGFLKAKEEEIKAIQLEVKKFTLANGESVKTNDKVIASIKSDIGEIESTLPEGKPDDMKAEAEANKTKYADIPTLKARIIATQENENQITGLTQDASELTLNINSLRDTKKKLIADANINIPGLEIGEEEILLNGLPFTKEQIATSQIVTTVFSIMTALNKKTPIFHIGRAESLGKAKLDSIIAIAEKNDYQLFIDRVASGEKLQIEIVENLDSNQQTLL